MMHRSRYLTLIALLSIALVTFHAGCSTGSLTHALRRYVTSRGADLHQLAQKIALPISGIEHTIFTRPILMETEMEGVELVQLPLGKALMIQCDIMGMRTLYRTTTSNLGQSLVFMVNGQAVGSRVIEAPIENGNLLTYLEISDEDLEDLVLGLKKTIKKVQR